MNILNKLLTGLFIFLSLTALSQNSYVLDLKVRDWNIKPMYNYFSEIIDERIDKSSAGKVHSHDKSVIATFAHSLQTDLKSLIDESIIQDSSLIPISVSVERFSLMETGSFKNHKISLDFSFTFYRIKNEKRYKLYESKGKPELILQGVYPNAPETLIRETLKSVFKNFNDWINQNTNNPALANKIIVIYEKDNNTNRRDTIIWNENYKLKWDDFKGDPASTNFMAQSNCIFSYRALPKTVNGNIELSIHLNACFDRNRSWVKPGQEKDILLAHEQLHFDICELNIRLLRKQILNLTLDLMDFDKQINKIFNDTWNEYQEQQQLYDDETSHGINADKQQKWENEINRRIKNISPEN